MFTVCNPVFPGKNVNSVHTCGFDYGMFIAVVRGGGGGSPVLNYIVLECLVEYVFLAINYKVLTSLLVVGYLVLPS